MKKIGTQLKELRKREALTVRYVSEKLHLRMGFISDIEHSRKEPADALVERMCQLYGYDHKLLFPVSELSVFQDEVGEWGDKTFNSKRGFDKDSCTCGMYNHLKKEVIELEKACRCATDPNIPTDQREAISEETADCFLLLLHLAHLHKFDLLEEARKKMEINRKRTWGEPDEYGVIEHV